MNNFDYYMSLPLHFVREEYEVNLKRNYPVAGLDDVALHFNHYTDFASANAVWERRKNRMNKDNLFVEMAIEHHEDIEKFAVLPIEHKIGFSVFPCSENDIYYFPVPDKDYLENKYGGNTFNFFNHIAMMPTDECRYYDILKLLNHEKDFMRVAY